MASTDEAGPSSSAAEGASAQGGSRLFSGIKLWFSRGVPQRDWLIQNAQRNGAEIVPLEKQADILLVDHARKNQPPGTTSYQFVERSIRKGALEDLDDHAVGAATRVARPVGSVTTASKGGRTPFTEAEDQFLWNVIQPYREKGGAWKGNEIYKQIEQMNPRHTFQSWRDHYMKTTQFQNRQVTNAHDLDAQPGAAHRQASPVRREPGRPTQATGRPGTAIRVVIPPKAAVGAAQATPELQYEREISAGPSSRKRSRDEMEEASTLMPPPEPRTLAQRPTTPEEAPDGSQSLSPIMTPLSQRSPDTEQRLPPHPKSPVELPKPLPYGFTDHEAKKLYKGTQQIINYINANPRTCNEAWRGLGKSDENRGHTAQEWKSFWETVILPAYCERRRKTLSDYVDLNRLGGEISDEEPDDDDDQQEQRRKEEAAERPDEVVEHVDVMQKDVRQGSEEDVTEGEEEGVGDGQGTRGTDMEAETQGQRADGQHENEPSEAASSPGVISCSKCFTTESRKWRRDKQGNLLCNECGWFLKSSGVLRPSDAQTVIFNELDGDETNAEEQLLTPRIPQERSPERRPNNLQLQMQQIHHWLQVHETPSRNNLPKLTAKDNNAINLRTAELAKDTSNEEMTRILDGMKPELLAKLRHRDIEPLVYFFRMQATKEHHQQLPMGSGGEPQTQDIQMPNQQAPIPSRTDAGVQTSPIVPSASPERRRQRSPSFEPDTPSSRPPAANEARKRSEGTSSKSTSQYTNKSSQNQHFETMPDMDTAVNFIEEEQQLRHRQVRVRSPTNPEAGPSSRKKKPRLQDDPNTLAVPEISQTPEYRLQTTGSIDVTNAQQSLNSPSPQYLKFQTLKSTTLHSPLFVPQDSEEESDEEDLPSPMSQRQQSSPMHVNLVSEDHELRHVSSQPNQIQDDLISEADTASQYAFETAPDISQDWETAPEEPVNQTVRNGGRIETQALWDITDQVVGDADALEDAFALPEPEGGWETIEAGHEQLDQEEELHGIEGGEEVDDAIDDEEEDDDLPELADIVSGKYQPNPEAMHSKSHVTPRRTSSTKANPSRSLSSESSYDTDTGEHDPRQATGFEDWQQGVSRLFHSEQISDVDMDFHGICLAAIRATSVDFDIATDVVYTMIDNFLQAQELSPLNGFVHADLIRERRGVVIPDDIEGCWTQKDDNLIQSPDPNNWDVMEKKHGREACDRRFDVLEMWNRV